MSHSDIYRVLYYKPEADTLLAPVLHELERQGIRERIEVLPCTHERMAAPKDTDFINIQAIIAEFSLFPRASIEAAAAQGVKLIATMSAGVNHIDLDAANRAGILVASCPGYCSHEVATHTLGLLLNLERQIHVGQRSVLDGTWDPHVGLPMRRLRGQTAGLVFFGRIARELAPMLKALGMEVLVWAPTKRAQDIEAYGCRKAESLDELLVHSDVVSLHCPLVDETRSLIGSRELALMKPGAFLINTARGEVIDEDALLDALEAGQLSGVGLDVLCHENDPKLRKQRLIEHPRSIITPHSAYLSVEAEQELIAMSVSAVRQLLIEGTIPENAVNPEALASSV